MIPKTKSIREQMDKLEFIKINNYCSSKDTVKKKKRKKKISHEEGEIMSGTYLIKDLNPEYTKRQNSRAESSKKEVSVILCTTDILPRILKSCIQLLITYNETIIQVSPLSTYLLRIYKLSSYYTRLEQVQ